MALKLGVEYLAKYPFLEEARDHVRMLGLSLEDIAHPDFQNVVRRAEERVLEAIRRREVSGDVVEPEIEILSFPLALMIVKATRLEHLISRYAHAEAVRVEKLLERERREFIVEVFSRVFKINLVSIAGGGGLSFDYKMPVADYLRRAVQFHDLRWKLVNRVLDRGYVFLKTHELVRLIRQEIEGMIRERVRGLTVPRLPENIQAVVQRVAALSPPPIRFGDRVDVTPEEYPPCVAHALDMLQKGLNIPHFGRFLLTTYLVNIGRDVDEVLSLYLHAPDFNERITRYQVEHIAGLRGGRVRYRCPSCRTLITHSFCFKTKKCDDIRSPLQFGLKRLKGEGKWMKRRRRS